MCSLLCLVPYWQSHERSDMAKNVVLHFVGLQEHVKILGLQCFPDSSEAKGTP